MRNVPNDIVSTLINKLPSVLAMIDLHNVDNRTFNAVRVINKSLKRLKKIDKQATFGSVEDRFAEC